MADRSPNDAAGEYVASIRRVVSCITRANLVSLGRQTSATLPRSLYIPGKVTRLKMCDMMDKRILFGFVHTFQIVRGATSSDWKPNPTSYHYMFSFDDGREILGYHWHPEPGQPVIVPHLHLGAGCGLDFASLYKAHLPTGVVSPAAAVRLAIADLGVEPCRDDWAEILARQAEGNVADPA